MMKSKVLGTNLPVPPDVNVRNAGLHEVASELLVLVRNVPVTPPPQSNVPVPARGARTGAALAGSTPTPITPAASAAVTAIALTTCRRPADADLTRMVPLPLSTHG